MHFHITFLDNVFISGVTFTSNKNFNVSVERLTSRWIFLEVPCVASNIHFSPIYTLFIASRRNALEDVTVKSTLESLQEISFQRAGFDALFHSGVVRIRNGKGIFFHMCGCTREGSASMWERGARVKNLRRTRWLGVQVSFLPAALHCSCTRGRRNTR